MVSGTAPSDQLLIYQHGKLSRQNHKEIVIVSALSD
jgi:hypothetical protein